MAMGIWLPGGGGGDFDAITAGAGDVLAEKVILDSEGEPLSGTMPERGSWNSSELAAGASVTIPGGHHSGSGKVTAKSLSAQTSGTATVAQILSGKTAWVNGSEVTGSMANRGNYGGTGNSRGNDTSGQRMWVKVPGGYYNENAQVFLNWSDICSMAGLTADKIKKNVSIMGITGTYVGEIPETYYIWTGSTWSIKNPGMTLTWADNSGGKIPYSAYASDTKGPSIDRYYNYRGNNYTAGGCARINHVFNLTPYKYLKFEKISSGTYDFPIFVGLSTNSNLQGNSYAAQFTGKFGKEVYSIDISKLSGNYYIYLGFGSYTANYKEFEQVFAPDRLYLTTA